MYFNYPYLKDSDFLKKIDTQKIVKVFVKITLLDWEENPIKEIQGFTTGGSINIDGSSAIRRTANLSMIAPSTEDLNITNARSIFSINKKMYLEIGYKNTTSQYPDFPILWYPQGLFIINSASINNSNSGISINLQLKDKMCLLNGECGGTIPASTEFHQYNTIDENGEWILTKPTINQIIRELVNHYGGEQLGKIIISDLDTRVKQVMRWIGDNPVYLVNKEGSYSLTMDYGEAQSAGYKMYSFGEDVGFIYTDFTYPKELIGDAGSSVCDVLDQIIDVLGNYEYFYDVYGNFHFQEIKNYLNITQTKIEIDKINNSNYLVNRTKGKSEYKFDTKMVVSSSNSPVYSNIKNDYIVWGLRQTSEGLTLPIRYHLAIDNKPKTGNFYEVFFYEDPEDGLTKLKMPVKYANYAEMAKNNGAAGVFYETVDNKNIYIWEDKEYKQIDVTLEWVKTTDWRSELYLQGVAAEPLGIERNAYYTELSNEWPKIYNMKAKTKLDIEHGEYYEGEFYEDVLANPSGIDFYLDFIESDAMISAFSVNAIGRRSKVENSDNINCVFEPDIPDFVLIESGKKDTQEKVEECNRRDQAYIQISSGIFQNLATGGLFNSAFTEVKNLLYQYTQYNEAIQINSLPVYYIEPNIRINVEDDECDIHGDYVAHSYSLPLDVGGTMSISATRVIEKL